MCDIRKKTQLKTMTVYKTVHKTYEGEYLSIFAKAPIKVGDVPFFRRDEIHPGWYNPAHVMQGNVSGFARKQDAIILANLYYIPYIRPTVLKIKLGGTILIGSTDHIAEEISNNHIAYASNKILSIEEIKI